MSNLETFRSQARKRIKERLGQPVTKEDGTDLDYLFRTTQALIKTNNEILERCESSRCKSHANNTKPLTYQRTIIHRASVTGRKEAFASPPLYYAEFDFQSVREEKVCAIQLEDDIGHFFGPPMREDIPYLVDYNAYLERAVALDDGTLALLLTRLKEHLEETQVVLGEVESWIIHTGAVDAFVKSRFSRFPMSKLVQRSSNRQGFSIPQKNSTVDLCKSFISFSLTTEDGFDSVDQFLNLIGVPKPGGFSFRGSTKTPAAPGGFSFGGPPAFTCQFAAD